MKLRVLFWGAVFLFSATLLYAEESNIVLRHTWTVEKGCILPSFEAISAAPAKVDVPAIFLAETVTPSDPSELTLWNMIETGLSRFKSIPGQFIIDGMAYGDTDGDSIREFILIGTQVDTGQQVILAARVSGEKVESTLYPIPKSRSYRGISAGDMVGDGRDEIVYYRVDRLMDEYWEGTLVMARIEGGEVNILGELPKLPLVDNVVVGDFDGDNRQEVAVVEGRDAGESHRSRAPILAAYSWSDGKWNTEPKAALPLDSTWGFMPPPMLARWNDRGNQKVILVYGRTIYACDMQGHAWTAPKALATIGTGDVKNIGTADLEGKGNDSILAWIQVPNRETDGRPSRNQYAMYVYQREN